MSQTTQGLYKTFKANSDLLTASKKYYIAKITATGTVDVATGSTQAIVGIIQEGVKLGDNVAVAMISGGGTSKVILGGTIAAGVPFTCDGNGKAIQAYQNLDQVIGVTLESGVLNDVIEVTLGGFDRWISQASVSPSASLSPSASTSPSASRSPSSSVSASISPSSSVSPS